MALEAVVFPHDLFNYGCKDLYSLAASLSHEFEKGGQENEGVFGGYSTGAFFDKTREEYGLHAHDQNWESSSSCPVQHFKDGEVNSWSPDACATDGNNGADSPASQVAGAGRRKRRRAKTCKNKEEVENQRMTHIAVERNRRRQMNEYLAVLRSLMPSSYVQRGDQASVIGGAINFVKELEQLMQSLEAQKRVTQQTEFSGPPSPFSDFFTYPQYSFAKSPTSNNESVAQNRSDVANIEVTMVESHASLKIFSKKRPRQLLKMVAGFHDLHLTVLHLNLTTIDQMVLYSFNVKVEDDCGLTSVDDIATAVYEMLWKIHEDS